MQRAALASAISVIAISVRANQIFSAGGNSGTACPSGSLYLYKRLETFKRFCWDFYKPE
jgi:hypothetical protein